MLDAFFKPNAIAVIGASRDPSKLGYAVLANIVESGYSGGVYPINPKAEAILGFKVYPDVRELPEVPDLAIIVIPYQQVPESIEACGQAGVKAVVVISAGFREVGMEGLKREIEVQELAKKYKIRLIGPNCLGVIDTHTPLNATFAAGTPHSGPIAFMSQSGALGTAILDLSLAGKRLGLGKFVSLGNKTDVAEADLLRYLADDEETRVILIYSEGLPSGREFMEVAREVTRKKPVIVVKSGVTQSGQRAVSSHTGSLAGAEQAYKSAFYQSGVLRAETMQAMFDYALGFAYQPLLNGNQIAIVTNAGGPGILATDALEQAGLELARLTQETKLALEHYLPGAASAANPVDVLGDAQNDRYEVALRRVAADPNVDGILVILTPQAMTQIEMTAHAVGKLSKEFDKPILACFMGEARIEVAVDILAEYGVPNYPFPERAAETFAAMRDYREYRDRPDARIIRFEVDQSAAAELIATVRRDGRVSLGDAECRSMLDAYGLTRPKAEIAANAEEAVRIASDIGYPVVLKIASPDILHKTDVGGVKVGLTSPADVKDAFELIVYRAQRYVPDARIWGCLVQEMVPKGIELLVGMSRDAQFGPLITFGLGGIYVEALRDVTFRIAPFGRKDAEEMLEEIRARTLLDGVRGEPAADKEAIIDTLLRMSQMVTDFPEIVEMDINPLVVYTEGSGAMALDMRLVLKS
ncbi:MAG: acetate--CoA ligase family protein [Anaerolineae bacterium]|nr:acetate--CoA ligase family protein [Anaerolineae bacterium]